MTPEPHTSLNETYIPALCYYVLTKNWRIPSWINVNGLINDLVPHFMCAFAMYASDFLNLEGNPDDVDVVYNFDSMLCGITPFGNEQYMGYEYSLRKLGMFDKVPSDEIQSTLQLADIQ
jgi:hypothetical protein